MYFGQRFLVSVNVLSDITRQMLLKVNVFHVIHFVELVQVRKIIHAHLVIQKMDILSIVHNARYKKKF